MPPKERSEMNACHDKRLVATLSALQPPDTAGPTATQSRVIKKLAPGENGARRHLHEHGKKLVCVRYREDDFQRYTTIELVVDIRPLPRRAEAIVGIAVAYHETELRQRIKNAGGTWDHTARLWRMPRETAYQLRLAERIRE